LADKNFTSAGKILLDLRGESGHLAEKRVSNILTSLQLANRTRTNIGYVLWLDRKTREQIHSLARACGVNAGPAPEVSARCEMCQIMTARPSVSSTTKPIEKGELRTESKGLRERGELREHGKGKTRRKRPVACGGQAQGEDKVVPLPMPLDRLFRRWRSESSAPLTWVTRVSGVAW
jgi:hypothetical protein